MTRTKVAGTLHAFCDLTASATVLPNRCQWPAEYRALRYTRMSGRKNEIVGGIKEGLGKLTGDDALEAEGTTQKAAGKTERNISGAGHEVKGSVKSAAGSLLDSPSLKAEGEAEKLQGHIERA